MASLPLSEITSTSVRTSLLTSNPCSEMAPLSWPMLSVNTPATLAAIIIEAIKRMRWEAETLATSDHLRRGDAGARDDFHAAWRRIDRRVDSQRLPREPEVGRGVALDRGAVARLVAVFDEDVDVADRKLRGAGVL